MIDIDWIRSQNAPAWAIHLAKEIQQLQLQSQILHARVGLPFTGIPGPTGTPIDIPEGQPDPTDTTPTDDTDADQHEDPGESPKTTDPTTE